MKKTISGPVTAVILITMILLASACAKPPTEDMNRAVEALTRAENDADAAAYASGTLARARDALRNMQEEAASKRYDSAKTYAMDAITYAERAVAEGGANAARAREEAAGFVNDLRAPLAETEAALNTARSNNVQADFANLGTEMDSAKTGFAEAEQNLAAGNYPETVSKCETVRTTLAEINTVINSAAQAMSRKQ